MLTIGLTGGIGSGKSTVGRIWASLGIPVYEADAAAKRLMTDDPGLVQAITERFGAASYAPNGQLDRSFLAQRVFSDPAALADLNRLVHPAVAADFARWAERQSAPYVVEEAAVLIESGAADQSDLVVVVTAPEALRIARVMERDGSTRRQVEARIAAQLPERDRLAAADFVLVADDLQPLIPQVEALHRQLLGIQKNSLPLPREQ